MNVGCIFTGTHSALPTRRLPLSFVHFILIFLLTVQITGKRTPPLTRIIFQWEKIVIMLMLLRKTTFTLTRNDTCYPESRLCLIDVMLRCLSCSVASKIHLDTLLETYKACWTQSILQLSSVWNTFKMSLNESDFIVKMKHTWQVCVSLVGRFESEIGCEFLWFVNRCLWCSL